METRLAVGVVCSDDAMVDEMVGSLSAARAILRTTRLEGSFRSGGIGKAPMTWDAQVSPKWGEPAHSPVILKKRNRKLRILQVKKVIQ